MQAEGVKAASPFILNQAMLTFEGNSTGVVVRGVDPDREGMVSDLKKNMITGEIGMLNRNQNITSGPLRDNIILGKELAH